MKSRAFPTSDGGKATSVNAGTGVLLAVESEFTATGLRRCLSRFGFDVMAAEIQDEPLLEKVRQVQPEVLIFEVRRPELRSPEFVSRFRAVPNTKLVLMVSRADFACVPQLIKDGVRACVVKNCRCSELVEAVKAAASDQRYFSAAIEQFLGNNAIRELHKPGGLSSLTEQERRVLTLIADGMENKEIAKALKVDRRTIETHRRNLKCKLQIKSVAGLTKFALKHCLASLD